MLLMGVMRVPGTGLLRRCATAVALAGVVATGALSSAGSLGCGKTTISVPITWESDVEAAIAKARHDDKPLVIYFGASWDTAAKELEYVTFTDPEVGFLVRRDFVAVHVDTTDDEDRHEQQLVQRFKVIGDPTVLILGPDATSEIARINEFVRPGQFASLLRRAARPDAVREARFEMAARARADEARWAEERRKADLAPPAFLITIPDSP